MGTVVRRRGGVTYIATPRSRSFRSPLPGRSWIIAGGCVLDTAALVSSTLDRPRSPRAEITVRSGYLCLRRIADVFGLPYDPDPAPTDPISVSREEWEELCAELEAEGIPLKADRDAAWLNFAGLRVRTSSAVLVGISSSSWRPKHAGPLIVPVTATSRRSYGGGGRAERDHHGQHGDDDRGRETEHIDVAPQPDPSGRSITPPTMPPAARPPRWPPIEIPGSRT